MIAVDTNVLIYANRSAAPLHHAARERLTALAEGTTPQALPLPVAWVFLRIVTQAVFRPPTTRDQALDALSRLTASPSIRLLSPGAQHWSLLRRVSGEASARGALLADAVIVALCREHGVDTILTDDRDFLRFPGIRVELLAARGGFNEVTHPVPYRGEPVTGRS